MMMHPYQKLVIQKVHLHFLGKSVTELVTKEPLTFSSSSDGSVDSSYEEGDMEEGTASSTVEGGYELASCADEADRIMDLAAFEEECSDEDDILLLYQEDTREWFICGKKQ